GGGIGEPRTSYAFDEFLSVESAEFEEQEGIAFEGFSERVVHGGDMFTRSCFFWAVTYCDEFGVACGEEREAFVFEVRLDVFGHGAVEQLSDPTGLFDEGFGQADPGIFFMGLELQGGDVGFGSGTLDTRGDFAGTDVEFIDVSFGGVVFSAG